jgi:hypothetical protein
VTASTRAKPKTPAERRAVFHEDRIAAAIGSVRARAWRAVGWLVAEGRRRPRLEWEDAVEQIVESARELNRRNQDDGQ